MSIFEYKLEINLNEYDLKKSTPFKASDIKVGILTEIGQYHFEVSALYEGKITKFIISNDETIRPVNYDADKFCSDGVYFNQELCDLRAQIVEEKFRVVNWDDGKGIKIQGLGQTVLFFVGLDFSNDSDSVQGNVYFYPGYYDAYFENFEDNNGTKETHYVDHNYINGQMTKYMGDDLEYMNEYCSFLNPGHFI